MQQVYWDIHVHAQPYHNSMFCGQLYMIWRGLSLHATKCGTGDLPAQNLKKEWQTELPRSLSHAGSPRIGLTALCWAGG